MARSSKEYEYFSYPTKDGKYWVKGFKLRRDKGTKLPINPHCYWLNCKQRWNINETKEVIPDKVSAISFAEISAEDHAFSEDSTTEYSDGD